jgi:hypothetical protein
MAVPEFREALSLLARQPSLWIPGIVAGACAAAIWALVVLSGTFFAGRTVVIAGLLVLLFTTGLFASVKENSAGPAALVRGGIRYYFRVLLPLLVIVFGLMLVFFFLAATTAILSMGTAPALVAGITCGIMIPVLIFTCFSDTAAVFEDRPVFGAIRRSYDLVTARFMEVIGFLVVSAVVAFFVIFSLMMVWEAFLYDRLEPLTRYTEAEIQAMTPEKMIALLGNDSLAITAAVLFIAGLLLVPVLCSYKACFYRRLAGSPVVIEQQVTGEYDSKGRWYKY